jgi:hypothetical protein
MHGWLAYPAQLGVVVCDVPVVGATEVGGVVSGGDPEVGAGLVGDGDPELGDDDGGDVLDCTGGGL